MRRGFLAVKTEEVHLGDVDVDERIILKLSTPSPYIK
jgi:hypothetical protein